MERESTAPSYDTKDRVEKTLEIYRTTSGPAILTANELMRMLETLIVIIGLDRDPVEVAFGDCINEQ